CNAVTILRQRTENLLPAVEQRAVWPSDVSELFQVAVPAMAAAERRILKEDRKAAPDRKAVGANRLIFPFAGQAEFAPRANVFRAAQMLAAEDGVNLRQREFGERVIFVDENIEREIHVADVEAAGGDVNAERRVAHHARESFNLRRPDFAPQNRQVTRARIQRAHRRGCAVHAIVKLNAGMMATKSVLPQLHQLAHEIRSRTAVSPQAQRAGDDLLGLVGWQ